MCVCVCACGDKFNIIILLFWQKSRAVEPVEQLIKLEPPKHNKVNFQALNLSMNEYLLGTATLSLPRNDSFHWFHCLETIHFMDLFHIPGNKL